MLPDKNGFPLKEHNLEMNLKVKNMTNMEQKYLIGEEKKAKLLKKYSMTFDSKRIIQKTTKNLIIRHDQQYYEGFLRIENFFLPCTRPQNFGVHLPVPQLWLHRLQFQCNSTRILADSLQSMLTSAKNHHMRLSVTAEDFKRDAFNCISKVLQAQSIVNFLKYKRQISCDRSQVSCDRSPGLRSLRTMYNGLKQPEGNLGKVFPPALETANGEDIVSEPEQKHEFGPILMFFLDQCNTNGHNIRSPKQNTFTGQEQQRKFSQQFPTATFKSEVYTEL
ncbi:hypothetical protein P5673_015576 [Acropora cervicornis]|uniref:Uncharacterized protein n=1 Tax=Acropora cervicornis TaxID=6130 RepID=A0AAD9QIL7_ACRCE|nr:hypothetical protein P5673_015576 [Acropora cervicornis]